MRQRIAAALATLTLVLAGAASPVASQDPAPPAAAPPSTTGAAPQQAEPAPAADPFKFASAAGLVSWVVKGPEAEDFELVWSVIRGRLASSRQPEMRAIRASLKLFKADTPGESDLTYIFLIDPAATTSYSVSFLLYESGMFERPEAEELFATLQKATVRVVAVPVDPMKGDAPPVEAPPSAVSAGASTVEPPADPR